MQLTRQKLLAGTGAVALWFGGFSLEFGPDSDIDDADGQCVLNSLDPGQTRCIALSWVLPESIATNVAQGDSVTFDLAFVGVSIGTDSPCTGGSA
ncbi:hypothetical protein [Halapricum desulfuricans]|uniref:Uncharacterized protein n=1 Tax=Halapricum desulfuricans TaxID=2841257 RepID=A0A897N6A8_9EURY|nr:hypothetical protein [Halapricum desulfuricans]QSG08001.1 hypothetical protein HSR122_0594 [Halapricum desulfuricans]